MAGVVGLVLLSSISAWIYHWRRDPGTYARPAGHLLAAGRFDEAASLYARAVQYSDGDPVLLLGLAQALAGTSPAPVAEALTRTQQMVSALEHAVELAPDPTVAGELLLRHYFDIAMALANPESWELLDHAAADMLARLETCHLAPGPIVWRCRAVAANHLLRRQDPAIAEKSRRVREMLDSAMEASSADPLLIPESADWYRLQAELAGQARDPAAEQLSQQAEKTLRDFLSGNPGDSQVKLALAHHLMATGTAERREEAALVLASVASALRPEAASSSQCRQAALLLRTLAESDPVAAGARLLDLAVSLLQRFGQASPTDPLIALELATCLLRRGQTDAAEAALTPFLSASRRVRVGPEAVVATHLQPFIVRQRADVCLTRAEQAPDPVARGPSLTQATALMGELEQTSRMAGLVELLRARLALAKGEFGMALDSLSATAARPDDGLLPALLAVKALQGVGETGAAAERLQSIVGRLPDRDRLSARLDLADLRLQAGDTDSALADAEAILQQDAENRRGLVLRASALVRRATMTVDTAPADLSAALQAAQAALSRLPELNGDCRFLLRYALLLNAVGQADGATRALEQAYQKNQGDLVLLGGLIGLDLDRGAPEAAAQRLERSLARDPSNRNLVLAASEFRQGAALAQVASALLAGPEDEVAWLLRCRDYYLASGQTAKATAELAAAKAAAPDDRRVLLADLGAALTERRKEDAEEIVRCALRRGLDPIQGELWRARIAIAAASYAEAGRILQAALAKRPTSSQGWSLLGDASRLAGGLPTAEAAYRRALQNKPELVSARMGLFQLYDQRANYGMALEEVRRLAALAPEDRRAGATFLNYLEAHGDMKEALRLRQALAARVPADQENRRALARLHQRAGALAKAEGTLAKLTAEYGMTRDNVLALACLLRDKGDFARGKARIEAYLQRLGSTATADDWLAYPRFLASRQFDDETVAAYRQAAAAENRDTMPVTRELAEGCVQHQRVAEALPLYEALCRNTQEPQAWLTYIGLLASQSRANEAMAEVEKYANRYGYDAAVSVQEGLLAAALNKPQHAERALTRAVELGPDEAQGHYQRARFRLARPGANRNEEIWKGIKKDLQRASELDPAFIAPRELLVRWYMQSLPANEESAVAELNDLISQHPKYAPARIELAEIYARQGKTRKLNGLLDSCVRELPDDPAWHRYRAQARLAEGRAAEAEKELAALWAKDRTAETLGLYASVLLDSGQAARAGQLLATATDLVAGSALLTAVHGRIELAAGNRESGLDLFHRALRNAVQDPPPLAPVIQQVCRALPGTDAIEVLDSAAAQLPVVQIELSIAAILRSQGQAAAAAERLERVLKQRPETDTEQADLLRELASVYAQLLRLPEAIGVYRRFLGLVPHDVTALNNLAYLLASQAEPSPEAIELAQRAVDLAPAHTTLCGEAFDTLGYACLRTGKLDQAEAALRRSLLEAPSRSNRLHMAELLIAKGGKADLVRAREYLDVAEREATQQKDTDSLSRVQALRARF